MNHFELFGQPVTFELDNQTLASTFIDLQRRFHPDKFASGSERDRLMAVHKAAEINDAYQILKTPIARAEYILTLQGVESDPEEKTMNDLDFLMQQMELREKLEEISTTPDPQSQLFEFSNQTDDTFQAYLVKLKNSLNKQEWDLASETVRKLKFINKLKDEVERIEDKLY